MRVLTILTRFGTDQYPWAEQKIDELFQRRMPDVERSVIVVDNALAGEVLEADERRVLIGGDNTAREFSGFDRAIRHIEHDIWSYDLLHFATETFNTLYVEYLERFDTRLLEAHQNRPTCVGHIDCYNDAVEVLGFMTQHWVRSCFFFLPPTEVKLLGSFVTVRDGAPFFSGNPDAPFRPDAPLSSRYRGYIIDWLTGHDIGQGVAWHSRIPLTAETLPAFEQKALAIMNEQLLGVRLRAMGCRLVDVTWLATVLARGGPRSVDWGTPWRQQLANRDRDALAVTRS